MVSHGFSMIFPWFSFPTLTLRGERELMGLCSRSLAWAERDYRLVSTGSQATDRGFGAKVGRSGHGGTAHGWKP